MHGVPANDHVRWWQLPLVLSLDAPLILVVWQRLLARAAGVELTAAHAAVLGLSVWLAYSADRWVDAWRVPADMVRTQRHRFAQRMRWPLAVVWVAAFAIDVRVASAMLTPYEWRAGLWLAVATVAYLTGLQTLPARAWRLPKELVVAALLGWGAALFPFVRPRAHVGAAVVPLALFVVACFANCAVIAVWERAIDEAHGHTSLVRQFHWGGRAGRILPWGLAVTAACVALAGAASSETPAWCAAGAGLGLGILDVVQTRLGHAPSRVLADAALLTPLLGLVLR